MENKNLTFEQANELLEKTVSNMESGELTLEQTMEEYAKACELLAYCMKQLEQCKGLGLYALIKKGWTPIKCIILILVVGILGCAFGIWTGDSKAIDENGAGINGGYNPLVEWYELPAAE